MYELVQVAENTYYINSPSKMSVMMMYGSLTAAMTKTQAEKCRKFWKHKVGN